MSGVNPANSGTTQVQPLLTARELAQVLGVHERTVWRLAAGAESGAGAFPKPIRIGAKTVRWRWRDVERYLDELARD